MKDVRRRNARKITPENHITRQFGELNSSVIGKLQRAIEEDPLQDLTQVLELQLQYYQCSLRQVSITSVPRHVSLGEAKPSSTQAEFTDRRKTSSATPSETSLSGISAPNLTTFPQATAVPDDQHMFNSVNLPARFLGNFQPLPGALNWEELFAAIPIFSGNYTVVRLSRLQNR
jgi:hypothetical protein